MDEMHADEEMVTRMDGMNGIMMGVETGCGWIHQQG